MPFLTRQYLPEPSFFRKLFMLASGTVVGQALVIASSPLLTRLFTPEEFGQFAVFAALIAIAGVMSCLRFEFAVPVIQDEDDAAGMVLAAAFVVVAVSGLMALLVFWAGAWLVAMVDAEVLGRWLWLLPLAVLLWGWGSILSYWSVRRGTYRVNGLNRTFQLGSQAGSQVAFGLLGAGTLGLVLGYLLGYVVRLTHYLANLPAAERRLFSAQRPARLWRVVRANWRYPAYSSASSLLQSICDMAPAILMAILYGPMVAGLYALCQRVIAMPLRFLSEAASQVFVGEVRELEDAELHRFFLRTISLFIGLGIVGMLPVLLFAPSAFALVFGEAWREAGVLIQLLVPLYFAYFIVFPISQLLHVLNRQDVHLMSGILNAGALVGSFGSAFAFDLTVHTTVLLFSLGSGFSHGFHLVVAWRLMARRHSPARAAAPANGQRPPR